MILRIISFILFILTLLSAFGGRINPMYVMLPSALTLALPYLAIATAIVSPGLVLRRSLDYSRDRCCRACCRLETCIHGNTATFPV